MTPPQQPAMPANGHDEAQAQARAATAFSRRGAFSQHTVSQDDRHVSIGEFEQRLGEVQDRLDDIHGVLSERMASAIAEAMADKVREVLADPDTAKVLMTNLRQAATDGAIRATGRGVWSVLKGLVQKWLLIALLLFTLAGVAGWQPAITAAKAIFGSRAP